MKEEERGELLNCRNGHIHHKQVIKPECDEEILFYVHESYNALHICVTYRILPEKINTLQSINRSNRAI